MLDTIPKESTAPSWDSAGSELRMLNSGGAVSAIREGPRAPGVRDRRSPGEGLRRFDQGATNVAARYLGRVALTGIVDVCQPPEGEAYKCPMCNGSISPSHRRNPRRRVRTCVKTSV